MAMTKVINKSSRDLSFMHDGQVVVVPMGGSIDLKDADLASNMFVKAGWLELQEAKPKATKTAKK